MADFDTQAIEWAAEQNVDIISMSWAIDKKVPEGVEVMALRNAIKTAADKNILLFCANPDKGQSEKNETYPWTMDTQRVFCIGAATEDGRPWPRIDPEDESCDFLIPGVDLGIPVESKLTNNNIDDPPNNWSTYSGSSLSCALAAGLAAMILHCTLVSGVRTTEERWTWLKGYGGMKEALDSIRGTAKSRWLPVHKVFGRNVFPDTTNEAKLKHLSEQVEKFFTHIPPGMRKPGPVAVGRATLKEEA